MITRVVLTVFLVLGMTATIYYLVWFEPPLFPSNSNEAPTHFSPKQPYGQWETTCRCGQHLSGTYIRPHYFFFCATCGRYYTNTGCSEADAKDIIKLQKWSEKYE